MWCKYLEIEVEDYDRGSPLTGIISLGGSSCRPPFAQVFEAFRHVLFRTSLNCNKTDRICASSPDLEEVSVRGRKKLGAAAFRSFEMPN